MPVLYFFTTSMQYFCEYYLLYSPNCCYPFISLLQFFNRLWKINKFYFACSPWIWTINNTTRSVYGKFFCNIATFFLFIVYCLLFTSFFQHTRWAEAFNNNICCFISYKKLMYTFMHTLIYLYRKLKRIKEKYKE